MSHHFLVTHQLLISKRCNATHKITSHHKKPHYPRGNDSCHAALSQKRRVTPDSSNDYVKLHTGIH